MSSRPPRIQRSQRRPGSGPAARPDITPLPDLAHGRSRAGPVRTERPLYVDLLPPCNAACPAGENIQAWLAHVAGRRATSRPGARSSRTTRCRPSTAASATTRARSSCNRAQLDSAVSIHAVERFLGDLAIEQGWAFDPPPVRTGKRVLVIGAGPERALRRLPPAPGSATRSRSGTPATSPAG